MDDSLIAIASNFNLRHSKLLFIKDFGKVDIQKQKCSLIELIVDPLKSVLKSIFLNLIAECLHMTGYC